MKKRLLLCVIIVSLCFLIASPQMLAATSVKTISSAVIDVRTASYATAVSALNMTFPAHEYVTMETFGNGTSDITISVNETLSQSCSVKITMETTIPTPNPETVATASYTPTTHYPGKLPDQTLNSSNDYLYFLTGGDYNDNMYVSYDHPDNYNVYYPGEKSRNYSLPNADYPEPRAQQIHTHLPDWMISNWIKGNLTTADVEEYTLGLTGAAIATGGAVLGGVISLLNYLGIISLTGIGAWVAFIGAVVGGIVAIIGILLSNQGRSQADYVSNVVEESCLGDGWIWTLAAKATDFFGQILDPYILRLVDPKMNPDVYENQIYLLHQYHRICLGLDTTAQFQQSAGTDRNSPYTYSLEVYGEKWVNSAFFG